MRTAGNTDAGVGSDLKLLLVDDNQVNCRLVELLVQRRGWRCTAVNDGQAGLGAWRSGAFDLILMDVRMPIMDGLEATRRIRVEEVSRGGHVPIVALTANVESEDLAACLAAGMDAVLCKPIHQEEFYRVCLAATGKNG